MQFVSSLLLLVCDTAALAVTELLTIDIERRSLEFGSACN
jgi:hypothetical protein